jgi:hypothetical protein
MVFSLYAGQSVAQVLLPPPVTPPASEVIVSEVEGETLKKLLPLTSPSAQPSGPVRLMPRKLMPSQGTSPTPTFKQAPSMFGTEAASSAVQNGINFEIGNGDIQVQALQQVSPDSLGVMDVEHGGFPGEMWVSTPRNRIVALIKAIPRQLPSPSMRDLSRRLILSTALVPPKIQPSSLSSTNQQSQDVMASDDLLVLRMNWLIEAGLFEDALRLYKIISSSFGHSNETLDPHAKAWLDQLNVKAHLARFSMVDACVDAKMRTAAYKSIFWQKLLVVCQLIGGDQNAAQFGADFLFDGGAAEKDPTFFKIFDQLMIHAHASEINIEDAANRGGGDPIIFADQGSFSLLTLAMMRAGNMPMSSAWVDKQTRPDILHLLSLAPNVAVDDRLGVAEQAAMIGAISSKDLAAIYASVDFETGELSNVLSLSEAAFGPKERAMLYQGVNTQTIPAAKVEVLKRALSASRQAGRYGLAVRVHEKQIASIPIARELWWFAGDAARALYALGRPVRARAWASLLDIEASRNPEAAAELANMWVLAAISGGVDKLMFAKDPWQAWGALQDQNAPEDASKHKTLAYLLLDAFGAGPDAQAWENLALQTGDRFYRLPNAARIRMMEQAAAQGRLGETVALVLMVLGKEGPQQAAPDTLPRILAALAAVGLETEARNLALEAAILSGL